MKRKGICFVCGCTHDDACPEGCGWANVKQTLCTACVPLDAKQRRQKRALALGELTMRWETLSDEANFIFERMEVLESEKP